MSKSLSKFDFYRGASAVVVVLAHACQIFLYNIEWVSGYRFYISNLAIFAVVVFFLLSGFLVTKSIISNRDRYNRFDWLEYFSSRLARIYPPFIFSLVIVFFVYSVIYLFEFPGSTLNPFSKEISNSFGREVYSVSVREFFASILMLGGLHSLNGPLWSLYYEFQLYVLAMLLGCGLLNKKIIPMLAFLVLFFLLSSLREEFWVYSFIWFLGGGVALFGERLWCKRIFLGFGFLSFVLIVIISSLGLKEEFFWGGEAWFVGIPLAAIVFSILIFYVDFGYRGFFVWIADFSYTLYIVHFPIMCLTLSGAVIFGGGDAIWGVAALVSISAAFLVSWLSAKYLERVSLFKASFLKLLKIGDGIFRRGVVRLY